jgi:hypothetical protein
MSNTRKFFLHLSLYVALLATATNTYAQSSTKATVRMDATHIMVGDQARLFIEVQKSNKQDKLLWATIPDTFNHLEVVEKGKIDTVIKGDVTVYTQRLLISGFDSGLFTIPSFVFNADPKVDDTTFWIKTDTLKLLVQTVPVDTSKPFAGIKGIMLVKSNWWRDYMWYIIGGGVLLLIIIGIVIYFARRKKPEPEPQPLTFDETLYEKTMRLLNELEKQELWQNGKIKEYYTQLTDIVRVYIEERFNTPAMELTTDELLHKARRRADMQPYYELLGNVLRAADLAKFAKAEPLPEEHTAAIAAARAFVLGSKINVTENTITL